LPLLLRTSTHELINLANNGRQETRELAEVQEVVQLCIKPIKTKPTDLRTDRTTLL